MLLQLQARATVNPCRVMEPQATIPPQLLPQLQAATRPHMVDRPAMGLSLRILDTDNNLLRLHLPGIYCNTLTDQFSLLGLKWFVYIHSIYLQQLQFWQPAACWIRAELLFSAFPAKLLLPAAATGRISGAARRIRTAELLQPAGRLSTNSSPATTGSAFQLCSTFWVLWTASC